MRAASKKQAAYLLPVSAPKWKHSVLSHSLRLGRLIELNAPDEMILNEIHTMVGIAFSQVPTDIENNL